MTVGAPNPYVTGIFANHAYSLFDWENQGPSVYSGLWSNVQAYGGF